FPFLADGVGDFVVMGFQAARTRTVLTSCSDHEVWSRTSATYPVTTRRRHGGVSHGMDGVSYLRRLRGGVGNGPGPLRRLQQVGPQRGVLYRSGHKHGRLGLRH